MPNQTAVRTESDTLSYECLNQRANQLAHTLLRKRLGSETVIGISLPRSPELIISLLAVMKCGAVYLPLSPTYPKDRLRYMVKNSNAKYIITQEKFAPLFSDTKTETIGLDTDLAKIQEQPSYDPNIPISPHQLAYIIYTSGTTGDPKGVLLEHAGLSNVIAAQKEIFKLAPSDRILLFSSINFDASLFEICMALGNASELFLMKADEMLLGEKLADTLYKHSINLRKAVK